MSDKYRDLRPRRTRECWRGDGIKKRAYTRREAKAKAAEHEGYEAYRCGECGRFHVGRKPTGPRVLP